MENKETAVVKRDPRVDRLQAMFAKGAPELAKVIPETMRKHLTPDRIAKIVISAALRSPDLLNCCPASILKSAMTATSLGLECDGLLGGAYLVPFNNRSTGKKEAQFIVGYRGLIDLARRSGNIKSIEAHVVREGDHFLCRLGTESRLEHTPNWAADTLGKMVAVYAVAHFRDGGYQFEVMTKAQVDAIRRSSKAGNFGPWKDHYEEMSRKTAVRRLAKYLPLTIDARIAMATEDTTDETERTTATGEAAIALGETIEVVSDGHGGDTDRDLSAVFDVGAGDGPVVHDGQQSAGSVGPGT